MGSAHSPKKLEQPNIISQEPRTPTISRIIPQMVHPASDPPQAPPILPHMFHSSPGNASEGDTADSTSKVVDRIHRSLGNPTVPQRPTWHPHPRSRELLEKKNEMWPLVDNKVRAEMHNYRRILQQDLRNLDIGDFGIMVALYGSSRTAQPSFIVLSTKRFPLTMVQGIPEQFGLVSLRYTHKERIEDVLMKTYTQNPYPGLAIGAADRSHTYFSLGWWVKDCDSGSVFNLTCGHSLREAPKNGPYSWFINDERGSPQVVDIG